MLPLPPERVLAAHRLNTQRLHYKCELDVPTWILLQDYNLPPYFENWKGVGNRGKDVVCWPCGWQWDCKEQPSEAESLERDSLQFLGDVIDTAYYLAVSVHRWVFLTPRLKILVILNFSGGSERGVTCCCTFYTTVQSSTTAHITTFLSTAQNCRLYWSCSCRRAFFRAW